MEASFREDLFEVASNMLNPLLLPISKDLHSSKQATFAEVKQFLLTEGYDMRLLSFFLPMFDICLEDDCAELEPSFSLAFRLLLQECIITLPETCS